MRGLYLIGLTYIGLSLVALSIKRSVEPAERYYVAIEAVSANLPDPLSYEVELPIEVLPLEDGATWFRRVRPSCNSLEVETVMRKSPPPTNIEGTGYGAACLGLAGKMDRARGAIMTSRGDDRWRAVGILFEVAHPIADTGDDLAAGPMMELTVEFWPNHYMALYHAGAARFELEQFRAATDYLRRFLENYHQDDGWAASAQSMLREIGK